MTPKGFAEAYVKRTEAVRERKPHSNRHTSSSYKGSAEALIPGLVAVEGISSSPRGIIYVGFGGGDHGPLQCSNCLVMCQWCRFGLSPLTLHCTYGLYHVERQLWLGENADNRFHSMILTQAHSL